MYHDNIIYKKKSNDPQFLLGVAVVLFLGAYLMNLGNSALSHFLQPLLGDTADSLTARNIAIGLLIAVLGTLNFHVLGRLKFKVQTTVVWIELLILFLAFFDTFNLSYSFILDKVGFLIVQGAATTLYISAVAIVIAFVLALIGAVAKLSNNGLANALASFYTSFFRGVPLLIQIYLIYLGLPQLGYVVDAVPAGILALSLCYGAYMTEIFRAGIQSIPVGQWEASRALGISPFKTLSRVIMPQALRVIIPPTGNQFIAMLKDSSLVSVIGVWELMYLAKTQGRADFRHLEMLITAAMIYWALSFILERVQARIEKRVNRSTVRG
ncbi:amino acid ABC transporter permease [Pseudomonas prosekii]|uniref:Glutamate/aspartate import permease protein GltK n=2 Tax=Pseudomonas prosekii TaxID=1148509 RepID=A0A2U2D6D3_9PSED|nr:amino acid ABC transporter permease [Pseudomonas prosekii]PWE43362.1 amino acid ABC transporter permease [Pseudomonas prosekii]RLU08181.1 amino acid ABC transporter permease [Pseudomonas prosekii]RLU09278.1 amino acid ABC transporter permease [Pseudomonas prosekii]